MVYEGESTLDVILIARSMQMLPVSQQLSWVIRLFPFSTEIRLLTAAPKGRCTQVRSGKRTVLRSRTHRTSFFTHSIDHADVVLAVNEKTELRTEFTAARVGRGAASRE